MKTTRPKRKPTAVVISDPHFNQNSIPLASRAVSAALKLAEDLGLPFIIAGDLNDTKAIIRAEVANAIIKILKGAKVPVYVMEGNHDKINEKADEHGLNYLRPYATIVDEPTYVEGIGHFIPYQNDVEKLRNILATRDKSKSRVLIMHQGVQGAHMGDYVVDKTSIEASALADFKCISGHYHRHQTVGTLTYIGSPYTISFGEANDGEKGFLILYSDGSFEREILDLRRHVIIETDTRILLEAAEVGADPFELPRPTDLLWLKVKGPFSELEALRKSDIAKLIGRADFKLDKICAGSDGAQPERIERIERMTDAQVMDMVIDRLEESGDQKSALKALWREVVG
jgi:DNA repair exonuclease SbcCD nuclease subunit